MVSRRRGFTLVETLVAIVILTIGVLGATGTALWAMRVLRQAEAHHDAVLAGAMLLDSLAQIPDAGAGGATHDRIRAEWVRTGDELVLTLRYADGEREQRLVLRSGTMPVLPELAEAP